MGPVIHPENSRLIELASYGQVRMNESILSLLCDTHFELAHVKRFFREREESAEFRKNFMEKILVEEARQEGRAALFMEYIERPAPYMSAVEATLVGWTVPVMKFGEEDAQT